MPKPGMMDFVGKAKWEAWKTIGDISQVCTGSDVMRHCTLFDGCTVLSLIRFVNNLEVSCR